MYQKRLNWPIRGASLPFKDRCQQKTLLRDLWIVLLRHLSSRLISHQQKNLSQKSFKKKLFQNQTARMSSKTRWRLMIRTKESWIETKAVQTSLARFHSLVHKQLKAVRVEWCKALLTRLAPKRYHREWVNKTKQAKKLLIQFSNLTTTTMRLKRKITDTQRRSVAGYAHAQQNSTNSKLRA